MRFADFLIIFFFIFLSAEISMADEPSAASNISVSATNNFILNHGEKDFTDSTKRQSSNYCIDYLDYYLQMKSFFFRGRFQVDAPSLGYNPKISVFREFFSRRTIGFTGEHATIEGGHIAATFGRGMSVAMQEDITTEKANIVDGILINAKLPAVSIKGFAGRGADAKKIDVKLETKQFDEQGNPVIVEKIIDNPQFRNNFIGSFIDAYPFAHLETIGTLSQTQCGGGIVYHWTEYFAKLPQDTVDTVHHVVYVPSVYLNTTLKDIDIGIEYAHLLNNSTHSKSSTSSDDESLKGGYAFYASTGVYAGDFYILGEYKNYFYKRKINTGYETIKDFLDPPDARYKHKWKLLTKHVLSKDMGDALGYALHISWFPFDPTTVTITGNCGGSHKSKNGSDDRYSPFLFTDTLSYWELYGEWEQKISSILQLKTGADFGKIDPEKSRDRAATAGVLVSVGPLKERHSFSVGAEAQYHTRQYFAEKSEGDALALVKKHYTGPFTPGKDSIEYYTAVSDEYKTSFISNGLNLLCNFNYSITPYVTLYGTVEKTVSLYGDDDYRKVYQTILQKEITSTQQWFGSLGITISPTENHTITVEGGTFSKGRKCLPPPCTEIPEFKGVKLIYTSTF